jgi:hypothetical protein
MDTVTNEHLDIVLKESEGELLEAASAYTRTLRAWIEMQDSSVDDDHGLAFKRQRLRIVETVMRQLFSEGDFK